LVVRRRILIVGKQGVETTRQDMFEKASRGLNMQEADNHLTCCIIDCLIKDEKHDVAKTEIG
jgi:hypothetical protein